MPDAHTTTETFRLVISYPPHEARENDSHYHYFNAARARLKTSGAWQCWINNADCAGDLEAHHSKVEYALINDVAVEKFEAAYPEFGHLSEEDFLRVCQEEGNLTILCRRHHIGDLGVHVLPYPFWVIQKVLKDGVAAPAHKVSQ